MVSRKSRPPSRGVIPWEVALAAGAVVSGARAILVGAKDGYAAAGLDGLAASSAARHVLAGFLPCALLALVLLAGHRWIGRRWLRVALLAAAVGIAYLFVAGRLPLTPGYAPGFASPAARLAHAGALLAGLAAGALLAAAARSGPALRRAFAGGSLCLLSTAALARSWPVTTSFASSGRPNVILISLDTVRADRLGCYGYERPTTPEIDRFFSRSSVRFEQAFASQPFTLTSHMTLLTGLEPAAHGVEVESALPEGVPTLAQLLSAEGYLTIGDADEIAWLHPRFGFDRGFDVYRQFRGRAASRIEHLRSLLRDLRDERFFLFIHLYDAHSDSGWRPYDSAPEDERLLAGWYDGDFSGCDEHGHCGTGLLWEMNETGAVPPEEDARYVSSTYDAGLRTLDRALGTLFRELEAQELLGHTVVVLTSDHGEEFFEHGRGLHTQIHDECMRVPLLFRLPGGAGERACSDLVGLADVTPTLLDLCGIEPRTTMQGASLREELEGRPGSPERAHVVLDWEHSGLRTSSRKLIGTENGWELYDVLRDPLERSDLAAGGSLPREAEDLLRALEDELQRSAEIRARLRPASGGVALTPSERDDLGELGYAGSTR